MNAVVEAPGLVQAEPASRELTKPPLVELPMPMPAEFLSFRLGAEEYGIDILRVQEIRSYELPTPSPMHRISSKAWSTCAGSSSQSLFYT